MHQPTLRVLKILELLADSKENLTLSVIAKTLNMPVGTLSPILSALQEKNYIVCKNKSYFLDTKILELSRNIKNENNVMNLIREYMKKIRDLSGQTCQMGILKNGDVLYLEKFDANNAVQLKSFVGTSYPAYATSLGKALLEKKTKKDLQKIYKEPFEKITKNTLKNIDELYNELAKIKKEKIAFDKGEMNEQIECMSFGIECGGQIIAAISISYLAFYANDDFRMKNKEILLKEKLALQSAIERNFPNLERIF